MKKFLSVSMLVCITSFGANYNDDDAYQSIKNKSIYTDIYQQASCNAIHILSFGMYYCI